MPIRSFEMVVEAIYEAPVKPGWLLQPFFQYVLRPTTESDRHDCSPNPALAPGFRPTFEIAWAKTGP
jgi:Carbohydrate-selective porin, OprB family